MSTEFGSTAPLALIADDDPVIRSIARAALEQIGMRVEEAENGREALLAFERNSPDLILMDVMMPHMDGFVACAKIRALPHGVRTPILIMTGLEDLDAINRAFEAGATDFVTKPINGPILAHRIRYMLRASRALEDLRENQITLARAQQLAKLGNWTWDLSDDRVHLSEESCRILGRPLDQHEVSLGELLQSVPPEDRDRVRQALDRARADGTPFHVDHRITHADGSERHVHQQGEDHAGVEGMPTRMIGTIQDVTERRQAESQIYYLAYYDSLTRLPNRNMFQDRLTHALTGVGRTKGLGAVLLLDLDRFQRINDTLGHSGGDRLLQAVADRLREQLRKSDTVARHSPSDSGPTIARLVGDEFSLLLTNLSSQRTPARIAERLLEALALPFRIGGHDVVVTASIGISLFPTDGTTVDSLLGSAEAALHAAKDKGRNAYQYYSHSMNAEATARLELENGMRKALEQGEFTLYYQPRLDLSIWQITGAEALIRWKHPERGLILPAEFIPVAEETGLIGPIGEWVLHSACEQVVAWQREGLPPIRVAVNVSALQFQRGDLVETVQDALQAAGAAPRYLELELTESALMREADTAEGVLKRLKALGIHIAMDDFGTGYSSLSYLMRFPIDTIKIDRSFITDLSQETEAAAIVTAIIALGHSLKRRVLAEGVETEDQMNFLWRHGCDDVQGFLFGRPLPADQFAALLRDFHDQDNGLAVLARGEPRS